jgi:hypothetical protein
MFFDAARMRLTRRYGFVPLSRNAAKRRDDARKDEEVPGSSIIHGTAMLAGRLRRGSSVQKFL